MPSPDDLLDALDPEQREVAQALHGPVCVVAGAGTGKTRAITHRIAYGVAAGVYKPTEVLAVTFTTRAAGQMRHRLRQLGADGVQARTFHAAALRQCRYFWPKAVGRELPELAPSKIPLLAEAAKQCRLQADRALLRDLASEVEWAKVSNVRPEDYVRLSAEAHRTSEAVDAETTARVFAAYEDVKRDRGQMDMEDILLFTVALLADDERVANQVRRQYRWLVVDEYQDVNALQAALLGQWLGDRDDVCVVGDPAQTIYTFAGASPHHLTDFSRRFDDAQRIELVRNYRSTPQIVDAANKVFARRSAGGVVLRAQRDEGDPVTYTDYGDEVAEAEGVAAQIQAFREAGTPLREIAVLYRVNAQSEAYEAALAAHGVPYVVRGVERFFDRPEVRQAVTLLRGQARSSDAGVPDAGRERGALVAETRAVLETMGYTPAAPTAGGAVRDRWESLHALVTMAGEMQDADADAGLSDLVAGLERRAQTSHPPIAEGVTLATLHTAKGLEWEVVFCVGMHEGTVPIVYATTDEAIEEERRLFYVGITRARRTLRVSWALARSPGGRAARRPSRFLDGLRPATDGSRPNGARGSAGPGRRRSAERGVRRCRTCNAVLATGAERKIGRCADCPATYDEALFEALRTWRGERASEQKVPAYCVFTDATLTAIAETRPEDVPALLAIPGIGRAKLDKYGDDVLRLCAQTCGGDSR